MKQTGIEIPWCTICSGEHADSDCEQRRGREDKTMMSHTLDMQRLFQYLQEKSKDGMDNEDAITFVIDVDKEVARALLARRPTQRPVSQAYVRRYAREMEQGEWVNNGEPIVLDSDLNLIQGQHRLLALVQCRRDFVLRNMDIKVVRDARAPTTYDQGKKRSSHDILRWMDDNPDSHPTTSQLRGIVLEQLDFDTVKYGRLSNRERTKIAVESGWVPFLQKTFGRGRVHSGVIAAAIRCAKKNEDDAHKFFRAVMANDHEVDGEKSEAVRLLCNYVLAFKRDGRRTAGEAVTRDMIARCIKAWNAWREGRKLKILRVRDNEAIPRAI